jgi:hypothetical protein
MSIMPKPEMVMNLLPTRVVFDKGFWVALFRVILFILVV